MMNQMEHFGLQKLGHKRKWTAMCLSQHKNVCFLIFTTYYIIIIIIDIKIGDFLYHQHYFVISV